MLSITQFIGQKDISLYLITRSVLNYTDIRDGLRHISYTEGYYYGGEFYDSVQTIINCNFRTRSFSEECAIIFKSHLSRRAELVAAYRYHARVCT